VVVLALDSLLGELTAALPLGVVELLVGWLLGFAGVENLFPEPVDKGAQFFVRALLHLRLQLIDPLHERFDAMELAVVRVHEAA
jgi:hypothetical protein